MPVPQSPFKPIEFTAGQTAQTPKPKYPLVFTGAEEPKAKTSPKIKRMAGLFIGLAVLVGGGVAVYDYFNKSGSPTVVPDPFAMGKHVIVNATGVKTRCKLPGKGFSDFEIKQGAIFTSSGSNIGVVGTYVDRDGKKYYCALVEKDLALTNQEEPNDPKRIKPVQPVIQNKR